MVLEVPLYRLQCGANSYDWGKLGSESAAARFAAATSFSIQEDKPYAELWMGTHPSNPSKDVSTGKTLLLLLETNQELVGSSIASKYGQNLPFLFKVLSIRKALSIQAHPDKKLAERLHAQDPKNYPDDNHKPEMAIAITPFDGFCGFRPLSEIVQFLHKVEPFRKLVGEEAAQSFISIVDGKEESKGPEDVQANKAALKNLYRAIMTSTQDEITTHSSTLIQLAQTKPSTFPDSTTIPPLLVRLNNQFPDDIGLFCTFVLNYVRLQPGEAMFLEANVPHAYLSGDIMECMASSDNVVRAGFTPKFKDVDNLVEMLTYSYEPVEAQKMKPLPFNKAREGKTVVYDPPIEEFAVLKIELEREEKETVAGLQGPSVLIATGGSGWVSVGEKKERVETGWVFFVGATAEVVLEADKETEKFVVFRAFCEVGK